MIKSNSFRWLCCLILMTGMNTGCQNEKPKLVEISDGNTSAMAMPQLDKAPPSSYRFEEPIQLKAGDEYISVDSPGYACPTMADVDGDGLEDLVVGQFNQGYMRFCKNIAGSPSEMPKFAEVDWIKCGDEKAKVPGVW